MMDYASAAGKANDTTLRRPGYVELFRRMRHRIEIWQPTQTPNAQGGVDTKYTVMATVWCDISPISDEGFTGMWLRDMQVEDRPTHKLTVRNIPSLGVTRQGLTKNMRMVLEQDEFTGRVFHVMSVNEIDNRGWILVINLKEVMAGRSSDGLIL